MACRIELTAEGKSKRPRLATRPFARRREKNDQSGLEALREIQNTRRRNEDGAVRTHNNTDHQREDESFDVVPTENEDGQQHDEGRQGGVDGPAQCAVQCIIHDLFV